MAAKPSLLRSIVYSFQDFEQVQVRSGTLTLVVTLLALTWLNSPWGEVYLQTWNTPISIAFGSLALSKPFLYWINQVLLALFFYVLVLELKRMLRVGELASFKDAAFPVTASIGGMAVSAGLYLYLNPGDAQLAWLIPMATDVAAVLALITLAGNLPLSLRVFLSSVAILQTISALLLSIVLISVIVNLLMLSIATGIFGFLVVLRALRNRSMWLYLLLGLVMLGAFLLAGFHGAIAGVLLAMVIPVHSRVTEEEFIATADTVMGQLHALHMVKKPEPGEEMEEDYQAAVHTLHANCTKALSPLRRLQHRLLPWAGFAVLPLFALTYTPFAYNNYEWRDLLGKVPLGIFLGLVVAKPIGILLIAWLSSITRLAHKPNSLNWAQVAGAALLAGTGFMMALFIGHVLSLDEGTLVLVKISIYLASAVAGLAGVLLLSFTNTGKN